MHVLIIPSWYPKHDDDIGGSFFREQAIALTKHGHKVGVITPAMQSIRNWKHLLNQSKGVSYKSDLGVNTYRFHSVNYTPRIPKLTEQRWVKQGLSLYQQYVKDHGVPDIIHVHSLKNAGLLAEQIYLNYDVPYIVTEHSSSFARGLVDDRTINKLQSVVTHSKKNIAVSEVFSNLLNKQFSCGYWSTVPNIVNSRFFINSKEIESSSSNFTFINVCLLSHNKRVDLLIRAFAVLCEEVEGISLHIGGDGPIKNELIALTKQLGIEHRVEFLGALTRESVKQHISQADAFVLASDYETFGVVLVEALALGKPVVATKCGGPESIVSPAVGYLVEKGSVTALAEGMRQLYINRDQYQANVISQYCYDNFSETAVIKQLTTIYTDVVAEHQNDSK